MTMVDSHVLGPAVVEAVDIHHHYGDGPQRVDVLFDINMQVREGEIVIVTGPSGSGKTTLLTILGTMRRPSEGKLNLLGADTAGVVGPALDALRNRIRFLFQKRNLLSSLTALQNVIAGVSTTPLADPAWDERRARYLLGLLGLADKADSWPDELSGGQQQRVAIARVMIGLPDLIIADEPTSALDRVAGRIVVDQLRDLAMRAKCAVVLSTHDERIFDVASRRLHIEDGRCFEVPIHYH
ncbi:MAG: ATP-binding cassette domain-containing protein [Reyranella sp.]|uniref:ABC transporter ATP-binding protein n=1 Tax=Reyranella sp. TaxID=1929291 RepID=UPI001AD2B1B1|nr:ATP-binding cassette domain-containing protein [Reyranella sp.]MBN9089006.1 ATP-binding cassette domain-containing protein [Reyranella sp.]